MHARKLAFEDPPDDEDEDDDAEVDEPVVLGEPDEAVDFEPQPAAARATTAAVAAILVMLVVRTAPPPDLFDKDSHDVDDGRQRKQARTCGQSVQRLRGHIAIHL
jgi:hypothetical protein